jgi:hypothetical protein
MVLVKPNPSVISIYSALELKRGRFPISTSSPVDNALDVGDLDAMFSSHIVSNPKTPDEFRLLVLGDSAQWGIGLTPQQTIPGQLDLLNITCTNYKVRVYNLSFPRSSATKDLMILDKALQFKPDMIMWFVTLYTLMPKTRMDHTLISQNAAEFYNLAHRFDFLPSGYQPPNLLEQIHDQNRALFRITRYQVGALLQLSTGLDQIPGPPEILPNELTRETTFEGLKPPILRQSQVSLDQVEDFYILAGHIPVLLVNEPMQILREEVNSDIRYNSYYPRWVYDQYRRFLSEAAVQNSWNYLDLWDSLPAADFTDTPLHLNPEAQHSLAEMLAPSIKKECP